jgi:AsmA-like C-terminal region
MSFASSKTTFWKSWVTRSVLIFIVILIIAFIILATHWPFTQSDIARALEILPGNTQITKFHYSLFPSPGCVAEGVSFTRKNAAAGPLFTARRVTIQARYADLFLRPGYIARIDLEGLNVQIPSGSEAEAFQTNPKIRIGALTADNSVLDIHRANNPTVHFDIHSLTLNSVSAKGAISYRVTMSNPLPPGEINVTGKLGPWDFTDMGQTPVSGTYTFNHADLSVFAGIAGMLAATGKFSGSLVHIETSGDINIPDFSVTRSEHVVPLRTQYQGLVNGTNGDVALPRVETKFLHTSIVSSAKIEGTQQSHGKIADIDLAVSDGRIEDLLQIFVRGHKPSLEGISSFRAHVVIPPGNDPFLKKLKLDGEFGVSGAEFPKRKTAQSVAELSERASGEKEKDIEKKQNNDEDPERVISDLSGKVDLSRAIANFSQLSFSVPGAHAQMHGTYGLITQKIDLHGTLKTDAKFTQVAGGGAKSIFAKPLDVVFKRKKGGAVIPVHLVGTYSDPQVGLDVLPSK